MTDRPTSKELEQRVKESGKFASENGWSKKSPLGTETLFRAMAEQSDEAYL